MVLGPFWDPLGLLLGAPGRLLGLLVFLELAGRLVRLLLLVEEVLGRGDPVVQLGALALQVAEVVEEASLHLRGVDVLDGGEAFPVDIFPGESREEDVD